MRHWLFWMSFLFFVLAKEAWPPSVSPSQGCVASDSWMLMFKKKKYIKPFAQYRVILSIGSESTEISEIINCFKNLLYLYPSEKGVASASVGPSRGDVASYFSSPTTFIKLKPLLLNYSES